MYIGRKKKRQKNKSLNSFTRGRFRLIAAFLFIASGLILITSALIK